MYNSYYALNCGPAADFGCQHVNSVFLPGHHTMNGPAGLIIAAGDHGCIEGSSMGPTIGRSTISSHDHVTLPPPPPRRAHTPPSQQQQLKWQALMVNEWHGLCDGALQDM